MDGGERVLWSRRFKPVGKVRRRVQDLRIPSSSQYLTSRPRLDLSHNESSRLAVDRLLSRDLEGYHEVLKAEGEVDFLSHTEKSYILEHGRDGNTGEPDDPSADCQSSCSAGPTDGTSSTLEQRDSKDVNRTDPLPDHLGVQVFFQSDSGAAGIKDLIRQFLTKAKLVLAVVMDSFSDPELLCDLLEASRKRHVCVHLLLDHLNLKLFVSMWQDLKLNSKHFSKLSVRSVRGRTYCARTGRKLTGQIAESFIIADWTEVLAGSYSFTWLSGQVHQGLAVLLRDGSVSHFHQEFNRLHSSSEPVPGFATLIPEPQCLCPQSSEEAQNGNGVKRKGNSKQTRPACLWAWNEESQTTLTEASVKGLHDPRSLDVERSKGGTQLVEGKDAGSHTRTKTLRQNQKPSDQQADYNLQRGAVDNPQHTVVHTQSDVGSKVEKNQDQIQCQSNFPALVSDVQSQPAGPAIIATADKSPSVLEPDPQQNISPTNDQSRTILRSSVKKSTLDHPDLIPEGASCQQNRTLSVRPSGFSAGVGPQSDRWSYSLNFYPKMDLLRDSPKLLSSSQQSQLKSSLQFPFTNTRGHILMLQTKTSSLETRRRDPPPHHSHFNSKFSRSHSAPAGVITHLSPPLQMDSRLFLPALRAKMYLELINPQQTNITLRLNWTPQKYQAARTRAICCNNSFSAPMAARQGDWRSLQTRMTSLVRSKSLTERHRGGPPPNRAQPCITHPDCKGLFTHLKG